MIGNSFSVDDTGWSVLEVGELDRATLSLRVQGYQITNRHGEAVGELCADREMALAQARDLAQGMAP